MRRQAGNAKIGVVVGLAASSGGSTIVSFFADTLPVVQWLGAVVAAVAGVIAIVLGVKKLVR